MPDDKFIEFLKDIGGLKPTFGQALDAVNSLGCECTKASQPDPTAHWDGKTPCPYCPQRFVSLRNLDEHVERDHNNG